MNRPVQQADQFPDGPVRLWIAVFTANRVRMGAAPCRDPGWRWRDGQLCLSYSPVIVPVQRPGTYDYGLICAVSEAEQSAPFRPLWKIALGPPHEMRAGDTISVMDGVVVIIPDYVSPEPAARSAPAAVPDPA